MTRILDTVFAALEPNRYREISPIDHRERRRGAPEQRMGGQGLGRGNGEGPGVMRDQTGKSDSEGPYLLDPELLAERVGQDLVVIHLGDNRIFELNPTAARIFELMRAGHGRQEIESRLLEEFEVEPAVAAAAFDRLVEALRERGLLR